MPVIDRFKVPESQDELRQIIVALLRDNLAHFCLVNDCEERGIEIQFDPDHGGCNLRDTLLVLVDPLEETAREMEDQDEDQDRDQDDEDDGEEFHFEPSSN